MRTERALSVITCLSVACWLMLVILPLRATEYNGKAPVLTKDQEERIRQRLEEDRDKYEKLLPVTIYGKVVDQYGFSIENADVLVSWEAATWLLEKRDKTRRDWIKTDGYGAWTFTIQKPFYATVKAKKDGYEESCGFSVDLSKGNISHDSPVVITLRKKGETTFLVKGEDYDTIRVFAPNSQTNSVDVLWHRGDGKKRKHLFSDFTVSAENVTGSNIWSVTYTATDATGGMIFTNELLYMAPADGYQRKVMLNGPPWPTYMYLRSRSPAIYSRILLKHDTWRELNKGEGFRMFYESWVNPYGERNLEYDNRLEENGHVKDELRTEAKAAIEAHRLPPKPDIPQRIKAMNKRLEKEKDDEVLSRP